MAQARCPAQLDACVVRLSRLDDTGDLDESNEGAAVLGPISLEVSPQTTEGDSFEQRDGCGSVCATAENDDLVLSWDLTLQLCVADWEAYELMTGGDLIVDAGDTIGHADDDPTSAPTFGTALEAWTKAWNGEAQYASGGLPLYVVHVWPRVRWTAGDWTMENGFAIRTFSGKATANPIAGTGPGALWPVVFNGIHAEFTTTTIPTVSCGTVSLAS